jgi:hypothetical protein
MSRCPTVAVLPRPASSVPRHSLRDIADGAPELRMSRRSSGSGATASGPEARLRGARGAIVPLRFVRPLRFGTAVLRYCSAARCRLVALPRTAVMHSGGALPPCGHEAASPAAGQGVPCTAGCVFVPANSVATSEAGSRVLPKFLPLISKLALFIYPTATPGRCPASGRASRVDCALLPLGERVASATITDTFAGHAPRPPLLREGGGRVGRFDHSRHVPREISPPST